MFEEYQDILTTEELAQMLRLNERTIIKLAKEGQLPAAKIASQFRFSKDKIIEWLDTRMHQYSDGLLADMEKGVMEKAVPIHKLLSKSHIERNLKATNKTELLEQMVELASKTGLVKNQQELQKCLVLREELCSTGIGNEVAFPHPRNPGWHIVKQTLVVIGIVPEGIEYDAVDKKPVKIFVMLVVPILSLHLQIISRLARIFSDHEVCNKVVHATTPEEIIEIIKSKEFTFGL